MYGSSYFGDSYFGVYFGIVADAPVGVGDSSFWFTGLIEPAIFTAPYGADAVDTSTAPETLTKHPDATRIVSVVFDERLRIGDTLTGTPVVTVVGLTAGAPGVNAVAASVRGQVRAIGTIVTFSIAGGADGTDYVMDVSCDTTNGETLVVPCRVEVRDGAA